MMLLFFILRREGLWHAIFGQTSGFLKDKLSQNMNANNIYILNKLIINLSLCQLVGVTCPCVGIWTCQSVCAHDIDVKSLKYLALCFNL